MSACHTIIYWEYEVIAHCRSASMRRWPDVDLLLDQRSSYRSSGFENV